MNYGAHLAHQKKSRLLSGESPGNVEHTLQFQHSKDDPSHGVKITNVGYNRAEKMPSAPGRERSATPDQIMDNTSKGSFGSRDQWKDASKAAYGKMEEHAHNAAYALNNWNAKDFASHAAKYIQGNPHLQDKLEQNVAYNWGRRAVQHVNNIRQNLAQAAKPKKEFFSLAKSLFEKSVKKKMTLEEQKKIIAENKKRPESKKPHKFKAGQWTCGNGHPQCMICGDEEPVGGMCNMPDSWYDKHESDTFTKAHASGYPLHKRLKWNGLDISIENRKGSFRVDKQHNPPEWKTKMLCDYGYIRGTEAVDGDHLDVFVGGDPNATSVFIINQNDPNTGKFDEQKCMLNFPNAAAAKKMYLNHYDSLKFFGSMKVLSVDEFIKKALSKKSKMVKSLDLFEAAFACPK